MHLLHGLILQFGDLAAFVLVYLAAAYVPLPSSLVIVIAGGLAAQAQLQLTPTLLLVLLASVLGDATGYAIARGVTSPKAWRARAGRHLKLARLANLVKRRPLTTIVWSRFVPFGGSSVNSIAGMSRMGLVRFLAPDVLGNLLYVCAYLALGEAFGRAWDHATTAATIAGVIAVFIGGGTVVGFLLTRRGKPLRAAEAS